MNQPSDKTCEIINTITTDVYVQGPPSIQSASSSSSSSSIFSSGDEQTLITIPRSHAPRAMLISPREDDVQNSTSSKESIGVPPANAIDISTNLAGIKRKAEEMSLDNSNQSEHVPFVVNILSKPALTLHKNGARKPRTVSITSQPLQNKEENSGSFLLACPEDTLYLSPLHCFVRRNIEVFVATAREVAAPCPGRKNSVSLGQVGLRCIHCRNVYSRNRTKRAVCYPSSVYRIYHCVSDMKFDHFTNCKYLPQNVRGLFDQLRESSSNKKREKKVGQGSYNTGRYYHDSAAKLGLTDGPQRGIVTLCQPKPESPGPSLLPKPISACVSPVILAPKVQIEPQTQATPVFPATDSRPSSSPPELSMPSNAILSPPDAAKQPLPFPMYESSNEPLFKNRLLAAPGDAAILAPIHCFVRKNVEIFTATPDDVAAPAPGRKTRVQVGQIGIRCIHCASLPIKQRVKRAVCYPPTISSIYHSVSNMKFDHFGACRGLSVSRKQEFGELRKCNPRSGKKANRKTTAQYYFDSAKNDLDLVDSDTGIRPRKEVQQQYQKKIDPVIPRALPTSYSRPGSVLYASSLEDKPREQCPTNGMSVLMMAATDLTIREAYEKRKQMTDNSFENRSCQKVLQI